MRDTKTLDAIVDSETSYLLSVNNRICEVKYQGETSLNNKYTRKNEGQDYEALSCYGVGTVAGGGR
jgi:hypothetical protein